MRRSIGVALKEEDDLALVRDDLARPHRRGGAVTTEAFPDAARAFLEFPQILRDHRFAIAGDQALGLHGMRHRLLAPLNLRRLHRAAHATLAPPPERHAEFDALFQQYFAGGEGVVAARSLPERDAPVSEGLGASAGHGGTPQAQ